MATMSLDKEIIKFLPFIGDDEKKSILARIKSKLSIKVHAKRMSKEEFIIQYNKDIDEAEEEIKAGFVISQEDLEKESETW